MANVVPPGGLDSVSTSGSVAYYAGLLDQQYPGNLSGSNQTLAQAYTIYFRTHPNANPYQVYETVITRLLEFGAIPAAIGEAAAASVTGAAAGAASIPAALPSISPNNLANAIPGVAQIGDFFASLGQANTWIRIGEVVLGLVLLAVGVARMTHAVPIATKVAKTAGAVALA